MSAAAALVVDDEPLNREALSRMCEGLGLDVRTAANGMEALAEIRRRMPDVVLLDLLMPELDGFGVLEHLRQMGLEALPAVIIVTAAADVHGRVRGTELGAIDFVEKPFRLTDMQRRVQRALTVVQMERRLKDAEKALRSARATDEATGLGTFAQLYAILEAEFRIAQIAERPLACALISDEGYARALESSGRQKGDERLRQFAARVEAVRRKADYLFRVDAAEFVMLLPATVLDEARGVVDGIVRSLDQGGFQPEHLAIGVAAYPHSQIDQASHLYRAANMALAQARSGGASQIYFERF